MPTAKRKPQEETSEAPIQAEPMSLDDAIEEVDTAPAKDVDGIPYCREHHCRMKVASGGKKGSPTNYYACPVDDCEERQQIIKTKVPGIVPPAPLACPRCSKERGEVICSRDKDCSTPSAVILKCPECGWKSNTMVVPHLAAAHMNARRAPMEAMGIGDR